MKNQKSLTNKGFSLVELIIVVAIMAVLIGVLAPQYLRYVEKSRLQRDNTSIGEIADVIKMMSADENLVSEFKSGVDFKFDTSGKFVGSDPTNATLDGDMKLTLGDWTATGKEIELKSNTYTKASATTPVVIHAEVDGNNVMTVTCAQWVETVGGGAKTKTF